MSILRPTEATKVVSMLDEDLDPIPAANMRAYEVSRDMKDLELDKYKVKPKYIVTALPLKSEYDNLGINMSAEEAKMIFARHVTDITNCDFKKVIKTGSAEALYDIEDVGKLKFDFVYEIATVIRKRGHSGDTTPFSMQGIWSQARQDRALSRHALSAIANAHIGEIAKDDHTQSQE